MTWTARWPPGIELELWKWDFWSDILARRDSFLLRLDPLVMASMRAWAADELRSVNGQIEFLLRQALQDAGRLKPPGESGETKSTKNKRNKRT